MRKRLKDLNVAEVACFLREERLKAFVDMVVEEEVRFFYSYFVFILFRRTRVTTTRRLDQRRDDG
jgi:hypothetical protein